MTSASNASTSTYRNLLKAVKVWPLQVKKSIRYKEFITSHIKTTFREPVVGETAAELQTRLSNAELQIESLKRLINDDSMKRIGPATDDLLMRFLPPKKLFTLLEKSTQDSLNHKTQFSFMKLYFEKKE